MVVVPLSKGAGETEGAVPGQGTDSTNWIRIAAAGTLAASGALLLTGNRRVGLVTAAGGTVLAMIDQQDVIRELWDRLPGFLEELQGLLSKAQTAVEDLSTQSQNLRKALSK